MKNAQVLFCRCERSCENLRLYGKALHGEHSDKWRYRVGDYRILAKIEDGLLLIIVVEVGHRKDIYSK